MSKKHNANWQDKGQSLLPWYVNGTLSEIELARLNQLKKNHRGFDQDLQREIDLAEAIRQHNPDLDDLLNSRNESFQQLKQSIVADKKPIPHKKNPTLWMSRRFIPAYGIAATFFIALGVAVGPYLNGDDNSYNPINAYDEFEVLTSSPVAKGVVMQIIFSADASDQYIQQALTEANGTVIGGPSTNGVYRVRISDDSQVEYWQQHQFVRWAEVEVY